MHGTTLSNFLSLVLKIPSPKQESVEAISIGPGLNDGFKGRRMVAEREEAGASSVHHLDRATIRQIENTLPGIQYRECKSENTISRINFHAEVEFVNAVTASGSVKCLCFFPLKLLKLGEIDGVKCLA